LRKRDETTWQQVNEVQEEQPEVRRKAKRVVPEGGKRTAGNRETIKAVLEATTKLRKTEENEWGKKVGGRGAPIDGEKQ